MTSYTDPSTLGIAVDNPVTDAMLTALAYNPIAMFEKAPGAPVLANGYVGQSQLKYATSTLTTTSTSGINVVLPGGEFGYWPQLKSSNASGIAASGLNYFSMSYAASQQVTGTSYVTTMQLVTNNASYTATAKQTYIQASPPYDLGDGKVGGFVFVLVDKGGRIIGTYSAQDAPWHNNGPTKISADFYDKNKRGWRKRTRRELLWDGGIPKIGDEVEEMIEITQEIKQRDMAIIPHPFIGNDLSGLTVVMLDPVSDLSWHLSMMQEQEISPGELIHDDYIRLDSAALLRSGPPGVSVVSGKWRNSR